VAGTLQTIAPFLVVDGTGKVRAFLAVCYILAGTQPDQNAWIVFSWILKELHLADRDILHPRHRAKRVKRLPEKPGLHQDPQVAHEHAKACEYKELAELTARNILLIRCPKRDFLSPERIVTRRIGRFHRLSSHI
jgi:hypothetical protein